MYKAIKVIGDYKIGEEVPTDKAEAWLKMYDVPHVEKVSGEDEKSDDEKSNDEKSNDEKQEPSENESSKGVMLNDYLGRNTNVVKKNVEEDDLSKKQLENLLELENSDKKRKVVINAIKQRLEE